MNLYETLSIGKTVNYEGPVSSIPVGKGGITITDGKYAGVTGSYSNDGNLLIVYTGNSMLVMQHDGELVPVDGTDPVPKVPLPLFTDLTSACITAFWTPLDIIRLDPVLSESTCSFTKLGESSGNWVLAVNRELNPGTTFTFDFTPDAGELVVKLSTTNPFTVVNPLSLSDDPNLLLEIYAEEGYQNVYDGSNPTDLGGTDILTVAVTATGVTVSDTSGNSVSVNTTDKVYCTIMPSLWGDGSTSFTMGNAEELLAKNAVVNYYDTTHFYADDWVEDGTVISNSWNSKGSEVTVRGVDRVTSQRVFVTMDTIVGPSVTSVSPGTLSGSSAVKLILSPTKMESGSNPAEYLAVTWSSSDISISDHLGVSSSVAVQDVIINHDGVSVEVQVGGSVAATYTGSSEELYAHILVTAVGLGDITVSVTDAAPHIGNSFLRKSLGTIENTMHLASDDEFAAGTDGSAVPNVVQVKDKISELNARISTNTLAVAANTDNLYTLNAQVATISSNVDGLTSDVASTQNDLLLAGRLFADGNVVAPSYILPSRITTTSAGWPAVSLTGDPIQLNRMLSYNDMFVGALTFYMDNRNPLILVGNASIGRTGGKVDASLSTGLYIVRNEDLVNESPAFNTAGAWCVLNGSTVVGSFPNPGFTEALCVSLFPIGSQGSYTVGVTITNNSSTPYIDSGVPMYGDTYVSVATGLVSGFARIVCKPVDFKDTVYNGQLVRFGAGKARPQYSHSVLQSQLLPEDQDRRMANMRANLGYLEESSTVNQLGRLGVPLPDIGTYDFIDVLTNSTIVDYRGNTWFPITFNGSINAATSPNAIQFLYGSTSYHLVDLIFTMGNGGELRLWDNLVFTKTNGVVTVTLSNGVSAVDSFVLTGANSYYRVTLEVSTNGLLVTDYSISGTSTHNFSFGDAMDNLSEAKVEFKVMSSFIMLRRYKNSAVRRTHLV